MSRPLATGLRVASARLESPSRWRRASACAAGRDCSTAAAQPTPAADPGAARRRSISRPESCRSSSATASPATTPPTPRAISCWKRRRPSPRAAKTARWSCRSKGLESLLLKSAAREAKPLHAAEKQQSRRGDPQAGRTGPAQGLDRPGRHRHGQRQGRSRVQWHPLPPGLHPILAVAVTPDGQFAACGRANQIFIYHVPTGQIVARLTDPKLAEKTGRSG